MASANVKETTDHYTQGGLLDSIQVALSKMGKSTSQVSVADLGPVDEFHTGGRAATSFLADKVGPVPGETLLDVGCGIGGTARFLASQFAVTVQGIDLTQEYVDTGNALNQWVGLSDKVSLVQGSALSLPFAQDSFDAAVMLHVGMNIENKAALFEQIFRCLKPGGRFVLYDMMRLVEAPSIQFPVPWANRPDISFLDSPDHYTTQLVAAGLDVQEVEVRSEFAREFFTKMRAAMAGANGPPPLGLQLVMGPDAAKKIGNMAAGVFAGDISPVQIVATKPVATKPAT